MISQWFNKFDDSALVRWDAFPKMLLCSSIAVCAFIVFYFGLAVNSVLSNYEHQKNKLLSVSSLIQRVADLEQQHHLATTQLAQLKRQQQSLSKAKAWSGGHLDLHRLAQVHHLTATAIDRLATTPEYPKLFVADKFSLKLAGRFFNYVSFRKTLLSRFNLIQIEHEQLSPNDYGQLDILIELSVHRLSQPSV